MPMYGLSSQFVHGKLEVAQEPFFENIDMEVNEYMNQINDMNDFGIMLIRATLQKIISENRKELSFDK